LNAVVGKAIEVTGQVEQFEPCGTGPIIRIMEQEQIRLAGGSAR
jgi:hypothetical protein